MKLFVAILVLTLVVALVLRLIRNRLRYTYVLGATVSTPDGHNYSVTFEKVHPDAAQAEYIWLCLFFAAKMLFNMGNDGKQATARALHLNLIDALGKTDLVNTADLVGATDQTIQLRDDEEHDPSAKPIAARVAFYDLTTRGIWTSIPFTWFELQFPHSFLAIVQTTLPKLDTSLRRYLQGSLARMAELYASGEWDPTTLRGLYQIPHRAFADAKVIANHDV